MLGRFVELVVFANIQITCALAFGFTERNGAQRRALEESHFDCFREAMNAKELALILHSVKR